MRGKRYSGVLDKIKVLRQEPLLVRFSLVNNHEAINCLVANKKLAETIMVLKEGVYTLSTIGYWNEHKQFVVKTAVVENPDKIIKLVGLYDKEKYQ